MGALHPQLCALRPAAEPLSACLLECGGVTSTYGEFVCEKCSDGPVGTVAAPSMVPSTVGLKPRRAGSGWPHTVLRARAWHGKDAHE